MNGLTGVIEQRLVLVLAHFLWQGTALAILFGIAMTAVRTRTPAARYTCSLMAFILLATCPVVTWFVQDVPFQQSSTVTELDADQHELLHDRAFLASEIVVVSDVSLAETPPIVTSVEPAEVPSSQPPEIVQPFSESDSATSVAVTSPEADDAGGFDVRAYSKPALLVWFAGVVLLSLRLLCGAVGLWRWRRDSQHLTERWTSVVSTLCTRLRMRVPGVRLSSKVSDALAVGLFRPLVLVPATWITELPPDMLEAVIAHELAHLRRRDLWVNLFQRVVETLFFYHPAVWWMSRRLRVERELCCDALAAEAIQDTVRYAETLEHVARLRLDAAAPLLAAGFSGRRNVLLRRVRQLLDGTPEPGMSRGVWLAGVLSLLFVVSLTLGISAAPEAQPAPESSAVSDGLLSSADEPDDATPRNEVVPDDAAEQPDGKSDIPVRYADAALRVAEQELKIARNANLRVPGAVPDVEIRKLELGIQLAQVSKQLADFEFTESDGGTAGITRPTDLYVRRAKAVLASAQHELVIATDTNRRVPGTVENSELDVLRMQITLAQLDVQIAERDFQRQATSETKRTTQLDVSRAGQAHRLARQRYWNALDVARRSDEREDSRRISRLKAKSRTAELREDIVEIEYRLAEARHAGNVAANVEADLLKAKLRLDVHELSVLSLFMPAALAERRAAQLVPQTLIRWGSPVEGVQIGIQRVESRPVFGIGRRIAFQFRIRNSSPNIVKTQLRFPDVSSIRFTLYSNHRITAISSGGPSSMAEFSLKPGEDAVIPETQFEFNTAGLESGTYHIESSYLFRIGEGDDLRKLKLIRPAGWRDIPSDLPLEFGLEPSKPIAAPMFPAINAAGHFDVAWGRPVQGLQAGLRYARGLEFAGDFNRFTDWKWSDGDKVEAEVWVRNVSAKPLTFSYAPGLDSDLADIRTGAHSVTPYDTYGPLQRRSSKESVYREYRDDGRRLTRTLRPGESYLLGQTSFIATVAPEDRNSIRNFPRTDRIWTEQGGAYNFRTRLPNVWNHDGSLRLSLSSGSLRLWMADAQPRGIRDSNRPELTPVAGSGSVVVRYSFPSGPDQADIVIRTVSRSGAETGKNSRSVRLLNGQVSQPIELPAGLYEVGRVVNVESAGMQHMELCDAMWVVVEPDNQLRVELARPEEQTVVAKHQIEGLDGDESVFITVHPGDPDKWNVGEPAGSFDYRAARRTLCATTCDKDGHFQIEPLPAGRYVMAVRVFEPAADGSYRLKNIRLPYEASCAAFEIYTDRGDNGFVSWFPNEFLLFEQWNHPLWFPEPTGN